MATESSWKPYKRQILKYFFHFFRETAAGDEETRKRLNPDRRAFCIATCNKKSCTKQKACDYGWKNHRFKIFFYSSYYGVLTGKDWEPIN